MTKDEQKRLLADCSARMPIENMAQKYGLTIQATYKEIERAQKTIPKEFQAVELGTPLVMTGDFLIVSDVHLPCVDWSFSQMVGRLAEKTGIRRLIIAGDFFDMSTFSRYEATVPPVTWAQERDAARVMLMDWLEVFQEIYTLAGNHERRLTKWAHGNLEENDIYGMVNSNPKITNSKFGYCTVSSSGIPWRITHPKNYGRNQLTVLSDIANKYQTNVIGAHEHHAAIGWDVYKRWVIVNAGMLADPSKFAYVSLDDNRMANMVKGFVMLRNGVATPLSVFPFTDWSAVLG